MRWCSWSDENAAPPPSPKPLTELPKRSVKTWSLWKSGEDPFAECLIQRSYRKFEENQGALGKADEEEEALRAAAAGTRDDDANTTLFTEGQTGREDDGMVATLVRICKVAPIPPHNRLLILSASALSFSVEILWSGMSAILHVLYHSRPRGSPRTTGARAGLQLFQGMESSFWLYLVPTRIIPRMA